MSDPKTLSPSTDSKISTNNVEQIEIAFSTTYVTYSNTNISAEVLDAISSAIPDAVFPSPEEGEQEDDDMPDFEMEDASSSENTYGRSIGNTDDPRRVEQGNEITDPLCHAIDNSYWAEESIQRLRQRSRDGFS